MKLLKLFLVTCSLLVATTAHAEKITVAAAADLKFAMDEIVTGFNKNHTGNEVQVVYGSSGKFHTQIQQGAPYDLFFSADIGFPRLAGDLSAAGCAEDARRDSRPGLFQGAVQLEAQSLNV